LAAIGCLLTFVSPLAFAADNANVASSPAKRANYEKPFEPPTRPALIALPPSAIEPEGWLRDWCLKARDGYTGHMDDYAQDFKNAWAANYTMTGDRLAWPNGAWPYEGGGYWFDGLARLAACLQDDMLQQQAKRRLHVLADHKNPNGILFLWWLDKKKPADLQAISVDGEWPLWACGLLGRAMASDYAGSGDPAILQTLEACYAADFDWVQRSCGIYNVWPALQTYQWTGNPKIAEKLTDVFSKDTIRKSPKVAEGNKHLMVMPNPAPGAEKNDHVVHFLETATPWALGYLWTGDRRFLDTALAWHKLLEREAMQPSGVPVADEFYGPTGAFRGTETCDVAGYLWSQTFLLGICGDGRMADHAERAFFNAGPNTVARDFKTHVYFQSPNRIVDKSPPYPHGPQANGNTYAPVHSPLCCTAALNRITPYYVTHMWMATYDNGLAAAHYGPCKVSAMVADHVPAELVCKTDYPFNETIDISVKPAKEAAFPLLFRVPGWCKSPELSVNGSALNAASDAKGFVRVERSWKPGDTVRLRFPMTPVVQTGNDRNADGAPYATVSYGPLLFVLPIADTKDSNTPDPAAKWRYALNVKDVKPEAITVERTAMPSEWNWPLASPLKVRLNAFACDWAVDPKSPRLPAKPVVAIGTPERITLIPYGCAKFRVAMFPVAQ
jgi:hypothetical protein